MHLILGCLLGSSILLSSTSASLDVQELAQVLSGTGAASLEHASGSIDAGELYGTFPLCSSSCGYNDPCVAYGESDVQASSSCSAASSYNDAIQSPAQQVAYCAGSRACCFPELCRRPVRSCSFDFASFVSNIEDTIDVAKLSFFARLATDELVEAMLADLTPNPELSSYCTSSCNGWAGNGIGDISNDECPSTCACSEITQAHIVASDAFLCKHTDTVDDTDVITYNMGDDSLAGLLTTDTRVVCKDKDLCMNALLCLPNEDFQRKLQEQQANGGQEGDESLRGEEAGNGSENAGAGSTSGLSTTALVLVIVGSVVALTLIVVAVVVLKKRKHDELAAEEPPTEEVYQEMTL